MNYNQDGNDDLAVFAAREHSFTEGEFIRSVSFVRVSGTAPFAQNLVNTANAVLLPQAIFAGLPVAGDFNADGFDDIAVPGAFGDSTLPVLFVPGTSQSPVFTSYPVTTAGAVSPGPGVG